MFTRPLTQLVISSITDYGGNRWKITLTPKVSVPGYSECLHVQVVHPGIRKYYSVGDTIDLVLSEPDSEG